MGEMNILFTSAGRRVVLLRSFRAALQDLGLHGSICVSDLKKNAPALHEADQFDLVPPIHDPGYISALEAICRKRKIKLLIPLVDHELHLLSQHRQRFEDFGTQILISSPETTALTLDKKHTGAFFTSVGVGTPKIFDIEATLRDPKVRFPLLIKPSNGSSSIGVNRVDDLGELRFYRSHTRNAILQEFITGQEYTLDVLVDFHGKVRSVVPRLRIETRAGEVSKGITVKDQDIIAAGIKVVEQLPGARGCITVQCFKTPEGSIQFIEINPRFGGGFPLADQAGAHFPRWILQWLSGQDPQIKLDGWQAGLAMLRFDDAVFVTHEALHEHTHPQPHEQKRAA